MRINRRRAITGIAVSAASGIGSLGGSAAAASRDPEMAEWGNPGWSWW